MSNALDAPTSVSDTLIGMETSALERWARGDPSGFLEISADDVVYFDPFQERRLNGIDALRALYEMIRGRVNLARWDLLDPHVQAAADMAVLTYNYVACEQDGLARQWHCTEVYRRDPPGWRIIQTHWSRSAKSEPDDPPPPAGFN